MPDRPHSEAAERARAIGASTAALVSSAGAGARRVAQRASTATTERVIPATRAAAREASRVLRPIADADARAAREAGAVTGSAFRRNWPHLGRAVILLAVLVLVVSAGRWAWGALHPDPYAPHAKPTTMTECNDVAAAVRPNALTVGFDFSDELHAWDDTVTIYVCNRTRFAGTMTLAGFGRGVIVSPTTVKVAPDDVSPFPIRVSVEPNATGSIGLIARGTPNLAGVAWGPDIVADRGGWRFMKKTHPQLVPASATTR